MAQGETPAFLWGAGYANTLNIAWPFGSAVAWSEPREGSEFVVAPSGVRDSWVVGTEYLLRAEVGWLPVVSDTAENGLSRTGWDGATGWAAFLAWAWQWPNKPRLVPNRSAMGTYREVYLIEPRGEPAIEPNGQRRVSLLLASADGSPFTGY